MSTVRIIPRLDIKGPNLVKGIHLEGLRVLGRPEDFAQYYYEAGADELIFQDVVASLYERNSLKDIISNTARNIFIPITVGGGIRTLDDIRSVLRAGADKVAINTAALKEPDFVRQASRKFGASTLVIAIEAIRQPGGEYLCFVDNGREHTGVDAVKWAQQVEEMGAGEILVTSVDRDGTGLGFDANLVSQISKAVSLPIIAHGGAGAASHISDLLNSTDVTAVAVASVLHYDAIRNQEIRVDAKKEGNIDFLLSGRAFEKISPTSIAAIKEHLAAHHFNCRN